MKSMERRARSYIQALPPERDREGLKTPIAGIDSYIGGRGRMHLKVLNLLRVADSRGPEMDRSGLRIPVAGTGVHDYTGAPFAYIELTAIRDLAWNARAQW